ncbi:hypothetical protein PanWU01x14_293870 [Parasponia andersonii]|uniref:Transmembrane protein n=1 Tax=Parasponia andersonii TaxID=3476 RepID=A0A2P5AWJ0_PARAD|nr:hypothetical protein PanWU01x14_293870 [Parasponia andersonii]
MEDKRRVSSSRYPYSSLPTITAPTAAIGLPVSQSPQSHIMILMIFLPSQEPLMVVSTFLLILISILVYNTTMNSPFWALVPHQCRLLQSPQRARRYPNRSRIWT